MVWPSYATTVRLALALGIGHPTLTRRGTRTWLSGRRDGRRIETSGRKLLPILFSLGLKPDMRCIDYGCGSLRVGRHLIELLGPERYVGLDLVRDFQEAGLASLDPAIVAEKRPILGLIQEWDDAECNRHPHDFLFANAVLQHVPPRQIDEFLARVTHLTRPGSISCLLFICAKRTRRIGTFTWSYRAEELVTRATELDPEIDAQLVPLNEEREDRRGRARMALVLTRRTTRL